MKTKITVAREAIEDVVCDLERVTKEAKLAGDRMAERNLEMRLETMRVVVKQFKSHEEYILQPRFELYFFNSKGELR